MTEGAEGEEGQPPDAAGVDEAPQRRRAWAGPWRSVVLPLVVVATIVAAIWYIESEGLPLAGGGGSAADEGGYGPVELPLERNSTGQSPSPQEERAAPDFVLEFVGEGSLRLSDLQGQAVVVNFWATWCRPCREEIPQLVAAYHQYRGQGLEILAVNLQEDKESVLKFAQEFGMDFPIVMDRSGKVADKYRVVGIPSTFFIDRKGVIRSIYRGPFVAESSRQAIEQSDLNQRIEEILR
ncbi:MAG: TlpA disulfide reductase family protein [Chloroflexota bacterium]|nr:TlpA disulfide reductase family protein [Chloroflexota bacterium]